ncbi:hypothetical protein OG894_44090 (plasmid) [Streptomyces sp. NBC_01724]|uniref:hypothetical protein n=1 Tax=Streptomyces sp. NBC_01724 TaxID=2975922 RepID=UPI002E35A6AC|nr:hypothetical protein [Streptomyces sp. NBC_01724]
MVLPGLPSPRDPGIAPTSDPRENDGLTNLALLAPNEHIVGDYHSVHGALAALRTDTSALNSQHPDRTFLPLPDVHREWQGVGIDPAILIDGIGLLRPRYTELGLHELQPLDRLLVGAHSTRPGAFDGFHHRDQGYRRLQMIAHLAHVFSAGAKASLRYTSAMAGSLPGRYDNSVLHTGGRS